MSVSIKYKGSEIAALAATGTKTLNTAGKYCEGNIIVENTESGGGDHTAEDGLLSGTLSGAYVNSRVTKTAAYAFYYFSGLTSVSIPNAQALGTGTFAQCSALKTCNAPLVTKIPDQAFLSCKKLTDCTFGALTEIKNSAFSSCTALTSLNTPAVTNIEQYAFRYCSALVSCSFPALQSMVGSYAFQGCSSLVDCNFPKASSVGSGAFYNCTSLEKADFGAVKNLYYRAFDACTALVALILRGTSTVCALGDTSALQGTPISSGTGYIYVPAALVDSYKAATNWSSFAAQIRAIEDYPEITGG